MQTKNQSFSPSTNIVRDSDKSFEYIVTPNSVEVYKQIVSGFKSGVHSYSIIGSYGTGKSSFLVALKRSLTQEQQIFSPLNGELGHATDFKFTLLVGKHSSLILDVANNLGLSEAVTPDEILEKISELHEGYRKKGIVWFLVLDEFGKYLEYAADNNPEKELYFIQQLTEFANEQEKNLFVLNTLHQSFSSYAIGLDSKQKKEWDKVKGRLKELAFNEPVDQLLYIAAENLKKNKKAPESTSIDHLLTSISDAGVFPLKNKITKELCNNLYPLEPLSGAVLAQSLQLYGQNERSLFSFLNDPNDRGINKFAENGYFSVAEVFDYLIFNHHSYIHSKYNPHNFQWNSIKDAIEKVVTNFDKNVDDYIAIVKIVGLLNLFSSAGAKINNDFLQVYLKETKGIDDGVKLIEELSQKSILRYRKFKHQYVLDEGTDYDIDLELHKASQKVELVNNIVPYLRKHFSLSPVSANEAFYLTGTPRYFKFELSENPINDHPEQPIDGIINLVFNDGNEQELINKEEVTYPILHGFFQNVEVLRTHIFEIHKIDYLLKHLESDQVAEKELLMMRKDAIEQLNKEVLSSVYNSENNIHWFFHGSEVSIQNQRAFNEQLSEIIKVCYDKSPVYKNELINKHKVSPAIYKPRKDLLRRIVDNRNVEGLGFETDSFPPEKTIYLSLLKQPGFHREVNGHWSFYPPDENSSLINLWNACEEFFESTKSGKKPLVELLQKLKQPPYGLKNGLLETWLPLYAFMKSNECALYYEEAYVPEVNFDILNLVYRSPQSFEIKAFNINPKRRELFKRYRLFQNQASEDDLSNKSFVETIRPFLLSYNDLNEYGRNTNKISEEARRLRDAIKTATDPEKAFFESFPQALGYTTLEQLKSNKEISLFIRNLDSTLQEIDQSFGQLLSRIEKHILNTLEIDAKTSFDEYVKIIHKRFKAIKEYRLAGYQQKLVGRLLSKLNDREKWLNSVGLAFIDKQLPKIKDHEEEKLFHNIETRLHELESLRELTKKDIDQEKEEAYQFKLIPLGKSSLQENISFSKKYVVDHEKELSEIRSKLPGSKKEKLAMLIKLLEETTNNE